MFMKFNINIYIFMNVRLLFKCIKIKKLNVKLIIFNINVQQKNLEIFFSHSHHGNCIDSSFFFFVG